MTEIISLVIGFVAPLLFALLKKLGLSGVLMLWVVYFVSIALAVGLNFLQGTLDLGNIAESVTIIVATSQTIFHLIKDKGVTSD